MIFLIKNAKLYFRKFRNYIETHFVFKYKVPRIMLWVFLINFSFFMVGDLLSFSISLGKNNSLLDNSSIVNNKMPDKYLEIAKKFAPIIYQGIEGDGFSDLITNFNYDGNWIGNDNWDNLDKFKNSLKPYIYYSILETEDYYYINYDIFHPRDWKGGLITKTILGFVKLLIAYIEPTQNLRLVQLSHENDLEGLVVMVKKGIEPITEDRVEYINIFSHDAFKQFQSENNFTSSFPIFQIENRRPVLYIEPKGHGISPYPMKENIKYIKYEFNENKNQNIAKNTITYDLLPVFDEFWQRAINGNKEMFANFDSFNNFIIEAKVNGQKINIMKNFGKIGTDFYGDNGVNNAATAPWGWREIVYSKIYGINLGNDFVIGEWFFNPAKFLKNKYNLSKDISETYLFHPYFGLIGEKID